MKPKIVFVVMSAVSEPALVDQLARSLAPHVVLVHHDFSQTPSFPLTAPNVVFVPDPKRTGWAFFGLVDGIFHSMRYAVDHLEFDYLQLLSPTCLPIKPIRQFEAHVAGPEEAHFDAIDLLRDRDALMSVGYRAFTPEKSLRHRVLRRLSGAYYATSTGRRDEAGIWLRSGGGGSLVAGIALASLKAFSRPAIGRHIFDESFRPYYGSAWFGACRRVVVAMVQAFERPVMRDYFSRLCIAEEFVIPTLLMHLARRKGPMNHFIQRFEQAHTGVIGEDQVEQLRRCGAYFARKFPDNAAAPVRSRVLGELVDAATPASIADAASTSAGSERAAAAVARNLAGAAGRNPSDARGAGWGPSSSPAT